MNSTTWTTYREYLDRVSDPAAAASLTLADALQSTLDQRQPDPATPSALTIAQAAERLGMSSATVYKMCQSGQLKSFRVGRARRIPLEAVKDLENASGARPPARLPEVFKRYTRTGS